MDEPTEEQLKILKEDILSGRVMIVEVEHYKRLTDNLDNSYNSNKAKDQRIKELEAENETEVKHPINSDGKINRQVSYCYYCGNNVRDQKYCQRCGRKLLWPVEQTREGGK